MYNFSYIYIVSGLWNRIKMISHERDFHRSSTVKRSSMTLPVVNPLSWSLRLLRRDYFSFLCIYYVNNTDVFVIFPFLWRLACMYHQSSCTFNSDKRLFRLHLITLIFFTQFRHKFSLRNSHSPIQETLKAGAPFLYW